MGQDRENGQSGDQEKLSHQDQFEIDIRVDKQYEKGLLSKEILVLLFLLLLIIIREVYLRDWVNSIL